MRALRRTFFIAVVWVALPMATASAQASVPHAEQLMRQTEAAALRRAKLRLLASERFTHPYYWAPFILQGTPQ